jgi:hypothetical protein
MQEAIGSSLTYTISRRVAYVICNPQLGRELKSSTLPRRYKNVGVKAAVQSGNVLRETATIKLNCSRVFK